MKLTCGVTITTHNRKDDLARTCDVLEKLHPPPDEVLICADGCNDGTEAMIGASHIGASHCGYRLNVHEVSGGSIASRDEMMREARSDILLSLDDDSYPMELDAVDRIRELFSKNEHLAVAAFPQRSNEHPESLDATDFGAARFIGSFSNAGAAIRKSIFLELGGYPVRFRHAYEEPDFALRCVNAGYQVRYEPSLTIRHHYTRIQRNEQGTHHYHARNELWSVLMHCPAPQFLAVAMFRLARQFGYARKRGVRWIMREPLWWVDCLAGLPRCFAERKPMAWERYRAWMELVRHPISSDEEWNEKFGRI